ncbi:MAG: helix-turn-helix transcriptional regulator [Bacilli bacterium]|nr:helix-turn-helix transcriptional regulator [Bacilli bacterium]
MNQIEIGKFIAKLRKENKMTQQELADKLNVTDRAVSKWENGRGVPDISLLQSLSNIFNVSLNELLAGERLEKNYIEKSEENLIKTIKEKNKIQKENRILAFLIVFIIVDILLIVGIIIGKRSYDKTRFINESPGDLSIYLNLTGEIVDNLYDITEGENVLYPAGQKVVMGFGDKLKNFDIEDKKYEENVQLLTKYVYSCYYDELNINMSGKEFEKLQSKTSYISRSNVKFSELNEINKYINESNCIKNIVSVREKIDDNDSEDNIRLKDYLEKFDVFMKSDLYKKKNKTFEEVINYDLDMLLLVYDLSVELGTIHYVEVENPQSYIVYEDGL